MIQIINNTGAIIKEQIILGDIDNLNIDDLFNNTNNKKMITQNYPTWLVPIEIAQQLKEIGFKEKCLFYSSMAITGTTTYECIEIEERIHNESPNCIELMELKQRYIPDNIAFFGGYIKEELIAGAIVFYFHCVS